MSPMQAFEVFIGSFCIGFCLSGIVFFGIICFKMRIMLKNRQLEERFKNSPTIGEIRDKVRDGVRDKAVEEFFAKLEGK